MNITRPNKDDLDAAWELVAFLNKIEQGLNPIYQPADPEDEDDFQYLSDAPADEVFEALEYKSTKAGLSWIMTVLDTLLSSSNDIVDQESSVLDFSPKFKQAVKDTERLDFLMEVGSERVEGDVMTTGMMIYLLVCGLIGLALVVLALMSLIENWFKQRTKAVVLDVCGMFFGLVVVLVAFLAILGVIK